MPARPGGGQRLMHQRGADPELAAGRFDRKRSEDQSGPASGADVPQPHGSHELALAHRRQGKACGGRTSVAQALAGALLAVLAKAGIEQRFTGGDVGSTLAADRERSGIPGRCELWLPRSSHGTSVLAWTRGRTGRRSRHRQNWRMSGIGSRLTGSRFIGLDREADQMW